MPNVNKQVAVGHLGRDPEMRYLSNGDAVANFSIAVSEKYKDKSGEWKENTEWIKCVVYRDLAVLVGEKFGKGDAIHVEGKNKTRKWQDKDGNDRYSMELDAYYVAMPIYAKKKPEIADNPTAWKEGTKQQAMPDDDIPF